MMKSKLFNISEKEKSRIRRLHLTEHENVNNRDNQIEEQLKSITGEYVSVSNRGEEMRAKWTYTTWEFDNDVWETVLNFLRGEGYEILDGTRNYYERNWEPEEPAESVPTIYFR